MPEIRKVSSWMHDHPTATHNTEKASTLSLDAPKLGGCWLVLVRLVAQLYWRLVFTNASADASQIGPTMKPCEQMVDND